MSGRSSWRTVPVLAILASCARGVGFHAENRTGVDAYYVDLEGTVERDSGGLTVRITDGVAGVKQAGLRVDSIGVALASGELAGPGDAWRIVRSGGSMPAHAGSDSEVVLWPATLRVPVRAEELPGTWLVFVVHGAASGPGGMRVPGTTYAAVDTAVTARLLRNTR
jgi:hypothetical protein